MRIKFKCNEIDLGIVLAALEFESRLGKRYDIFDYARLLNGRATFDGTKAGLVAAADWEIGVGRSWTQGGGAKAILGGLIVRGRSAHFWGGGYCAGRVGCVGG